MKVETAGIVRLRNKMEMASNYVKSQLQGQGRAIVSEFKC